MSDEVSSQSVLLDHQPVELYKILKFEGFAGSGAEAKQLIDEGQVHVNGEPELRRRRKIVHGDKILLENIELRVLCEESSA